MKRSYRMLIGAIFLIGLFLCFPHPVAASPQDNNPIHSSNRLDPTGLVTAQGAFYYYDRHNELQGAGFTKVSLYDYDLIGGDDLLFTTYTIDGGSFTFPSLTNDDNDDPFDPDRHLDLYVIWETYFVDLGSTYHKVTYIDGLTYRWQSSIRANVQDGPVDITGVITQNSSLRPAMWIFQDLRKAWVSIYNHTTPNFYPGSVTAKWQDGEDCYLLDQWICSSFFYGINMSGAFIFIRDQGRWSADETVHETGHNYMYRSTGWWWWILLVGIMKCFPK